MFNCSAGWKVITDEKRKPFKYGENDCCLLSIKIISAFRGKKIKGIETYQKGCSIKDFFKLHNCRNLTDAVTIVAVINGWTEINPTLVQPADLLLIETENFKKAVAVNLQANIAVTTGKNGILFFQRHKIIKAWRTD